MYGLFSRHMFVLLCRRCVVCLVFGLASVDSKPFRTLRMLVLSESKLALLFDHWSRTCDNYTGLCRRIDTRAVMHYALSSPVQGFRLVTA
jgi:hypothetical protein